jgi:hypothetical protein
MEINYKIFDLTFINRDKISKAIKQVNLKSKILKLEFKFKKILIVMILL